VTKKIESGDLAKNLYVVNGMSMQDIAARLGVSYRALQNWKKEGAWEAEKKSLTIAEGMTHSALHAEFVRLLTQIRYDSMSGEVDIERYRKLEMLSKSMQNMLSYEKNAPKKSEPKISREDYLREVDRILTGER
jgi:transposase